jgi:hypothetical protein
MHILILKIYPLIQIHFMSRIISLQSADVPLRSDPRKDRIQFLDLAKGFTVLFIPSIHTVMLYSSPGVYSSWPGSVLGFIAEWPGAQLLMFVMGMSFSMSKKRMIDQLKRALFIFIAGYCLNVLKFLILLWSGWTPVSFIHDLNFSHHYPVGTNLFLIGDILQFAGIAVALMAVLKCVSYYAVIAVLLGYIIILFSPVVWDWHHPNLIVDHLLHLAGGNIDDVFFPLFPWLVYPLTGLAIGNYLQMPFSSIQSVFLSGLFLLVCGFSMHYLPWHFPDSLFWRTYPDQTIMHLGFVMVWISLWFGVGRLELGVRLSKILKVKRYMRSLNNVLRFCGCNITVIYLVQWVVVFWMLPLFGYRHLDVGESLIAMGFINVVVFGIVWLIVGRKIRSG